MNRIEKMKEMVDLFCLLKLAKQYLSYDDLERITGFHTTELCRYARGEVLPTTHARKLRESLTQVVNISSRIIEKMPTEPAQVLSKINRNPYLLWFALQSLMKGIAGTKVDHVLTISEAAIPFAALLSQRLGCLLAIATENKPVGVAKLLEAQLSSSDQYYSRTLYIPRDEMKSKENVLIVTAMLSSGATEIALAELIQKAGANIIALFALVEASTEWKPVFSGRNVNAPPLCAFIHMVENDKPTIETPEWMPSRD
jgi:adenine/guanine phosphoribosyltransferase-like PRPP-binding protein